MKLVVTIDGKVGKLVLPLMADGKQCYIAAIPNKETEHTLYDESECDILEIESNCKLHFSNKEFKRLYENIERECNSAQDIERWLDENITNGAFKLSFIELLSSCREVLDNKDDLIAVMIAKRFMPCIHNHELDFDKQYKLASSLLRDAFENNLRVTPWKTKAF